MNPIPMGIPSAALAATPLPDLKNTVEGVQPGEVPPLDSVLYLRQFILNCQLAVGANEVLRHRMLKDALHALCFESMRDGLEALVEEAADALYSKLTEESGQ